MRVVVKYLRVGVDLGLDLLGDDEVGDFMLHLLHGHVKGLGDLPQVDHFVGRHVLDEGLSADIVHQALDFAPEIHVKGHLLSYLSDLTLELHVSPVEEVLDYIL